METNTENPRMRSTGLVRRIDELGRVIIPGQIRKILGIEDGTPLELFVEGEMVIFKEYTGGGGPGPRRTKGSLEHTLAFARMMVQAYESALRFFDEQEGQND